MDFVWIIINQGFLVWICLMMVMIMITNHWLGWWWWWWWQWICFTFWLKFWVCLCCSDDGDDHDYCDDHDHGYDDHDDYGDHRHYDKIVLLFDRSFFLSYALPVLHKGNLHIRIWKRLDDDDEDGNENVNNDDVDNCDDDDLGFVCKT